MNRPGCLSANSLLAALVTLLVIAVAGLVLGGDLFNPGALNAQASGATLNGVRSHAEIRACSACHAPFWSGQRMADRCLDCHAGQLQAQGSFHPVMLAESKDYTCHHCHTDHNGEQAVLTVMDLSHFPHDSAGFSLQAHQKMADGLPFACSDCHRAGFSGFDQAVCSGCHQDLDAGFMSMHRADFGEDCLACHDGVDTYGKAFDHNRAAFPLQGGHAVACSKCHNGARDLVALKSAPQACSACHAGDDVHGGRFGQDCAQCHTSNGWQEAAFDHSKSAFPLVGKHVEVACQACHRTSSGETVYQGTPKDCFACHAKDDSHAGQFGQDCGSCHNPNSWQEAAFDHSRAAFPLTGAHQKVTCDQCHQNGVFKGTPQECAACHTDPAYHLGLFDTNCAGCHTVESWSPASFDGAHTFPLNHGGNAPGECRACHPDSLSAYTCYGCHEHNQANIAAKHQEEGIRDFQDCVRCHPTGREEEGGGGGD